jgi:uncharacterized phiE125 gp8 family phage protein
MRYKLKTAASFEPVTLEEAKRHLRVLHNNQDELISSLVKSAVKYTERYTGRILANSVYTGYLDRLPDDDHTLITLGPVQEIVSIKYYAPGASELSTYAEAKYDLDNSELTARLWFRETFTYDDEKYNPIEIEFKNGWATKAEIPDDIITAIVMRVNRTYLNPDNPVENKLTAADQLLRGYKVKRY